MTDIKQNLLLFFERPKEPCFMKKGKDSVVFEMPDHYFPEDYRNICSTLKSRFSANARVVKVREIALPDLSLPKQLSSQQQFSLFVPSHREMAGKLIDIFMGMRDLEDLQSLCAYCQMVINPYLFNYCLSVAIMHRPDTKGLNIPTIAETFPAKFVNPQSLQTARALASATGGGTQKAQPVIPLTIPVNLTASDREPEQRVAYFREDIGINLHHWHWHLVYPFDSANSGIVNKDRRGELFYYMHQQIVARYNAERLCNGLLRVIPFSNLQEPIAEAYFPKLTSTVSSRAWPPRFANTKLQNVVRPVEKIKMDLIQAETWRMHFLEAVENMSVILPNNSVKALDEETGIDVLGNMMEASIIGPNKEHYGDFHNLGHIFMGYSHDPDNRHLESAGVIGDSATAMRDPVFYRWHKHIDDLFQIYKNKLPPYQPAKLNFPGVKVSSVRIEGSAGTNTLSTFWEQSLVDLSHGLDFSPRGSLPARFTHLQHEEFNYVVEVNNTSQQEVTGTVRIFIAPINDDDGNQFSSFDTHRKLMIELDKFSHKLTPGNNTIRRSSVDSSVTIPYERTFRNQAERPGKEGTPETADFDFCGCGWPHHMLIPKGTEGGYPMVLFVMVSNWAEDKVEQDLTGTCSDAASYCGIRDRKYPDRQAMGYPFDRPAPRANYLKDFLQPNMAMQNCTIRFTNKTKVRGAQ